MDATGLDQQWLKLTVTKTGTSANGIRFYLNGIEQAINIAQNTLTSWNLDSLGHGALRYGLNAQDDKFTLAYITDIRMYGRALSKEEVTIQDTLTCDNAPITRHGLVLWAPLNEGRDKKVYDYSDFREVGTMIGSGFGSAVWSRDTTDVSCQCAGDGLCFSVPKTEYVSYRFGFQGQEVDNEIRGNGNSINYKYRMHDPRIGRFFAVDPLTAKYPFYSPYAFSGNRVIDAVELEGLEPKTIIEEGKLTQSVKMFMKPALNVSQASLDNVTWYTQTSYQESGDDGPIDSRVVKQALSTHGAITVNSEQVVYRDSYKGYSAKYFVGLIAHEHTHVGQYLQFGYLGFVAKYGAEVAKHGYRDAPMEVRAYNIGDAMDAWLASNPNVVNLLNTDRSTLNANQLSTLNNQIETAGKQFRYEKGIDTEISFWSNAASDLLNQIENNGYNLDNAPSLMRLLYDAYRQEITNLQVEKETLKQELNVKN